MSIFRNSFFIIFALVLTTSWASAQTSDSNTPKLNSPYSRLGLGDLSNPNFAALSGMGGFGASFHDPYHTNWVNPASLSFLRSTSFELGLYAQHSSLQNNDSNPLSSWSGNIDYLSLAFPIQNPINDVLDRKKRLIHWGMGIALTPYSVVGYNINSESIVPVDGTTVITNFQGRGGTYKVQWGNSVRMKGLSLGFNLGYLFGKIINERDVSFIGNTAVYNDDLLDEISVNGLVWDIGLMYQYQFQSLNKQGEMENNGKSISIGAYGNSNTNASTNSSQFYRRRGIFSGTIDTLTNSSDVKGDLTLPATLGFGIMYEDFEKFRVGLDYATSQWSNYVNTAKPENLKDAFRASIGVEFLPDVRSYNSYLKKMRYRLGAFYQEDPRSNLNEQLTAYGITFGLGFPVILPRQQKSFVNLALELGRFGDVNTLRDTYFKATVGFTLNDNSWFFKRKFE